MISTQASTARTVTRSSGRWARESGPGPVAGRWEFPPRRDLRPRYRQETRRTRSPRSRTPARRAARRRPADVLDRIPSRDPRPRGVRHHPHPGVPAGRSAVTNARSSRRNPSAGAGECAHADRELRVPRELAESFPAAEMLAGDDGRPVGIGPVRQRPGRKSSSIRCCRRQARPTACSPRERPSDAWPPGARTRMTANAAPRVAIGRRS